MKENVIISRVYIIFPPTLTLILWTSSTITAAQFIWFKYSYKNNKNKLIKSKNILM